MITYHLVIDDLEECEAQEIKQFLENAVSNGDLGLAIQDCMTIKRVLTRKKRKVASEGFLDA